MPFSYQENKNDNSHNTIDAPRFGENSAYYELQRLDYDRLSPLLGLPPHQKASLKCLVTVLMKRELVED